MNMSSKLHPADYVAYQNELERTYFPNDYFVWLKPNKVARSSFMLLDVLPGEGGPAEAVVELENGIIQTMTLETLDDLVMTHCFIYCKYEQ